MQALTAPPVLRAAEELNPLIPHPVEIVLSIVVFAILFFAVKKFVVPSFEATFAERTTAIEGGLAAAETKQAEADAKLAELEKQLADARHEAARIREEAREQGAAIVVEMREQAQTEASRIVDHGKAQIEAERQQAVTSLGPRSAPSPRPLRVASWASPSMTTRVRVGSSSVSSPTSRPAPRARTDGLPWSVSRRRGCADRGVRGCRPDSRDRCAGR